MSESRAINLEDLVDIAQKRWYFITIPFFFFVIMGFWLYFVLPREYEASTLILVQPQEIPSAYVVATVSSGLEERVRTLAQEVMSRSNLEKVITEMDLFKKERKEGQPMEGLVRSMRTHIKIDVTGRANSPGNVSSFVLTFSGRDPQLVADVTNRLASLFIESNLTFRARQATETTEFLEKQLADLKTLLENYEKKVQEYRDAHMGMLPEQLGSNTATLTNLQSNLESVQRSLTDARNRKVMIQGQITQLESNAPEVASTRDERIAELRRRLQNLQAIYTSEHPEIKRLNDQIRELQNQPHDSAHFSQDPKVVELRNQLRSINMEITGLQNDVQRIKSRIDFYQARVESTPKAEQEQATLNRDYKITQDNYQKLLDRLYEAKRAESLEKRQQGEQFRILDLAQPPQTPVRPNLLRLLMIFLALGLGSGAGLLLMMEYLDNSVKGIRQMEELSGNIPCISAIPLALTQADTMRRRKNTMILVSANVLIVVFGLIAVIGSKVLHVTLELPFVLPF